MSTQHIKPILLAILVFAIFLSLTFSTIILILDWTILNPDFYDYVFYNANFYEDLRSILRSRIYTELPFSQEGKPYIDAALSSSFIRNEFINISNQLHLFFINETDDLPLIKIKPLEDAIVNKMDDDKQNNLNEDKVNFWLGAIPDEIRFQDIVSLSLFHEIRKTINYFLNLSIIVITFLILTCVVLYFGFKELSMTILTISSATLASAITVFILSIFAGYIYQAQIVENLILNSSMFYEFKPALDAITQHLLLRIQAVATIMFVASILSFCLCRSEKAELN